MRVISRIDVKNDFVIKGIHLEGLRKVGNPNEFARDYYDNCIDEILFMDAVASLYDRNNLFHVIKKAAEDVFVPITLGGGIRTIEDISSALDAGADKIAINTAAVRNPKFVSDAANTFGNQCVVGSIEAKSNPAMPSGWEVYVDNGRERTDKDVLAWALELQDLGAGEMILTSVDNEGTKKGFDVELFDMINRTTKVPIVISGGMGKLNHLDEFLRGYPSGVALASVLHYKMYSIEEIKKYLSAISVEVRKV